MRVLWGSIGLSFLFSALLAARVPVGDELTLKQKAALLFVAADTPENRALAFKPLAFVGASSSRASFAPDQFFVADMATSLPDECDPIFPNNQTIASCNDPKLVNNLVDSYLKWKPQWCGVLAGAFPAALGPLGIHENLPSPSVLLVFKLREGRNPEVFNRAAGVIPLPALFMAKKQPKSALFVKSPQGADPLGRQEAFRIDPLADVIGFSLDDVLERPYLFKSEHLQHDVERLARAVERNLLNRHLFEERVKWALALRMAHQQSHKLADKAKQLINHQLARRAVYENAVVLARNDGNRLPFRGLEGKEFVFCDFRANKTDVYSSHVLFHHGMAIYGQGMSALAGIKPGARIEAIVLCDAQDSLPSVLINVHRHKTKFQAIDWTLVLSDEFEGKSLVRNDYGVFSSVTLGYSHSPYFWECAAEALFGGLPFRGRSVLELPSLSAIDVQFSVPKSRMRVGIPAEVGMNSDTLKAIDRIVKEAIDLKAAPGVQVLVARHGVVVYHKAFGKTDYQDGQPVTNSHLYDVASVTKVMSTTPLLMYLADRQRLEIQKTLKDYIPELANTNKANIAIAELLVHKSGLQANMPTFYDLIDRTRFNGNLFNRIKSDVYPTRVDERLFIHRDVAFKNNALSNSSDTLFTIEVAKGMYLSKCFADSLRKAMDNSPLDNLKAYKYSDLGLGFLQRLVERNFNMPIDKALDSVFLRPMDLVSMAYRPLDRFDKQMIVPTEHEQVFRKQTLQGYVHDPAAALMGGVAGHAGLFANSAELAKMMQMYLDGGRYGDQQILKPETVSLFTSRYDSQSRRGLGFDKPDTDNPRLSPVCAKASKESFGHTGFTGTIVWADPKTGLVMVFLSNRVCPDSWNKRLIQMDIRSKVMAVAYAAINQ